MRCLGHEEIECQPCGLTLMPAHSYLGASTDGIIRNHKHHNEHGPGVLGIKYPFSINKTPVTRRNSGNLAKEYSNFCLEYNKEGRLALKRSSPYYMQVQGEMAIKNAHGHILLCGQQPMLTVYLYKRLLLTRSCGTTGCCRSYNLFTVQY